MQLKYTDIFTSEGVVEQNIPIHYKKTGKTNTLHLKPIQQDLLFYQQWLAEKGLQSEWLFPSIKDLERAYH